MTWGLQPVSLDLVDWHDEQLDIGYRLRIIYIFLNHFMVHMSIMRLILLITDFPTYVTQVHSAQEIIKSDET